MDEPTLEDRLAALRARRQDAAPEPDPVRPKSPPPVRRQSGVDEASSDSIDGRLAALQARRLESAPVDAGWEGDAPAPDRTLRMDQGTQQPVLALASEPTQAYEEDWPPSIIEQLGLDRFRLNWSPSRFVAAGTSAVSFGAMIVAMGPLLAEAENTDAGAIEGTDLATQGAVPEAPSVEIELNDGNGGLVPGAGVDPANTAPTAPGVSADDGLGATTAQVGDSTVTVASNSSETVAPTTAPAATSAPTTAAPTTAGGSGATTAAPTTAAPTTAAPTTAAPTTAAPTTAAPTTAPPTTAAPTTAPPTTAGSE